MPTSLHNCIASKMATNNYYVCELDAYLTQQLDDSGQNTYCHCTLESF